MCSQRVDVVDVVATRAQTARIIELCDQLQGLQAELTSELGDWLGTSWWSFDGARSPEEWLRLFGRLDVGDARRVVQRSRLCGQLPGFADAFAAGEITAAHVDVLACAVGGRRLDHAIRDAAMLLEAARHETVPAFERTVAGWRQHCDRELAADDAEQVWEGRKVHLRPDLFGSWSLTGTLDPDGGAAVSAALAANRNDPDPIGGPPRSLGQRNADALVALATGDSQVEVTMITDLDLTDDDPTDGSAAATVDTAPTTRPAAANPSAARAEVNGVPIPSVIAERLACGASVSTVLRRGRSILDVTAATPTITVGQRRALLVRDPVCRFPGCAVVAHRCDIHHLRHRAHGGEHRLDNLMHLCRHHHRFVHEHRWRTTGTPDGELRFHPPPDREADHWLRRTGAAPP